ncbi:TonB-dependent receptor domain-containing protein [Pasteurella canis]
MEVQILNTLLIWLNGKLKKQKMIRMQKKILLISAQEKKFKKHSYSLGATFDPLDFVRLQVKYSKGFRAPTSDELYFTFKHPDFYDFTESKYEAEEAKNQEIALTFHHDWGFFSTSVFQTKYRHFIDLAYLGSRNLSNSVGGQAQARDFQVYLNVDSSIR